MRQLQDFPRSMFLFSLGLILLIGLVDYQTGTDLSMLFFYIIPVLHATWFINHRAGVIISLICAGMWFFCQYILPNNNALLAVSLWNMTIRLSIFLLIVYIVTIQTALHKSLEREKNLSRTDNLTGAVNSRAFREIVTQEINRAQRTGQPFSLAYIDLDNFKLVNDTLGHKTGDKLLILVVQTLNNTTRTLDTVARLGGDEFAILLPETSLAGADAVVTKCRQQLLSAMQEKKWPVSASIGLASFMTPPESYDSLIHLSDELMYEAKKSGKNRVISKVIGQEEKYEYAI